MSDLTPLQRGDIGALEEAYEAAHNAYWEAHKAGDIVGRITALCDIDRYGDRLRSAVKVLAAGIHKS